MGEASGRKLRHAIIGAGMAGILAAIKLKQKGEDFVVFEKADKLGGTWRDNRYPGLTCDVPAHAYTYSFEPYADWPAYYATGAEVQGYFERVADKYGIVPSIRFGCEVVGMDFDEAAAQWVVGRYEVIDANDRPIRGGIVRYKRRRLERYRYRALLKQNIIPQPAVFWRADFGRR